MPKLDPSELFRTLVSDIPADLLSDVFVVGSVAAAYAYKVKLHSQAVNTKDADLLVHPAGNVVSTRAMAEKLLGRGWRRKDDCYPQPVAEPTDALRLIRLHPPTTNSYFIELLNVPVQEQKQPKTIIPVKLNDGFFGLASFKFMGVTNYHIERSTEGIAYAAPGLMALSNLLSHRALTDVRIESGEMRGLLRCAKDLGRTLALAFLEDAPALEQWADVWISALKMCFPESWRTYAASSGNGLRELLENDAAMEEARTTTEIGLLNGLGVDVKALRGIGKRVITDAIEPLEASATS
jgi:hypothetical protein